MEIQIEDLESESLEELLAILEGMDETIEKIEGEMNHE